METVHARNVIVGGGAMGAAAAYHLAKRGEPVLLLEQFALGHDRGSSHGAARITRHSYADPDYARLMLDAFRAWRGLEADAGKPLYVRTGGISFCPSGVDYVDQVTASLAAIDVPHRRMSGGELERSIPAFRFDREVDVVFEPDAGMLAAARSVAAQVELARQFGGEKTQILENCPVLRVDREGDRPVVLTAKHRIVAERLIVTAGSWIHGLIPGLSFATRPTRQQVLYFRPSDAEAYAPGRLPVFIFKGEGELDAFYGMPQFMGLGVKVARHGGAVTDPNVTEREVGEEYRRLVQEFLATCLPGVAEARIDLTETCLYTVTPDDHFRVGALADCPEVIIASPCSGHGFKFSCLVGKVLADLAIDQETAVAIGPWRL